LLPYSAIAQALGTGKSLSFEALRPRPFGKLRTGFDKLSPNGLSMLEPKLL